MKPSYIAFLGIAALVGIAYPAFADRLFTSGHQLLERCRAPGATFYNGLCSGFIIGVYDGHVAQVMQKPSIGLEICIPADAIPMLLTGTVLQYLTTRADLLKFPAATIVYQALVVNFPCQR